MARCLNALFALFDDETHREAIEREFPGSSMVAAIDDDAEAKADEYVRSIFELIERWPVLAPLAGTTDTARYDLPAGCSDTARQWVTVTRGNTHYSRGAYQKAETEYEQILTESRDTNHRRGEATSLGNLGLVAHELSEYEDARKYLDQSLAIFRDIGDRQGEANSLRNLGEVAQQLGEYEDAREYHQQSLIIARDIGDHRGKATSLNNLGAVAYYLGEYEDAREYLQQSLAIFRELDHPNVERVESYLEQLPEDK